MNHLIPIIIILAYIVFIPLTLYDEYKTSKASKNKPKANNLKIKLMVREQCKSCGAIKEYSQCNYCKTY